MQDIIMLSFKQECEILKGTSYTMETVVFYTE